ncbi:MAG: SMC-Scp complex subunit ScpB [Candidatus Omnitrophica bacterium CG08_land_8_20_14_0_20_41_16]|nr:MAG: SMC-Scp complex subunit ScpB [Candidatus Omnitrophica bacterium CG08_land_8_20_14_0_20_41_16]
MEDNRKSVMEALLFASEKPLTLEKIRDILDNLSAQEASRLIEELKVEYEQANRGMRIIEIAGGFQMITASSFAPFLKKLFKDRNIERLSKPALETLAIIAYKQPLTRSEIELLRNVNVDGIMKNLLGKNLVRICGRKKTPGNPYVYGTTRQFLEYFGLKSLQDLPRIKEFSALAEKKELVDLVSEEQNLAEGDNGPKNITR